MGKVANSLILAMAVSIAWSPTEAKQARSHKSKAEFKRRQPCPSTGQSKGSCPGYVVDHVVPLCAGGQDTPNNMQWQTVEDAKLKDRQERRQCRSIRD